MRASFTKKTIHVIRGLGLWDRIITACLPVRGQGLETEFNQWSMIQSNMPTYQNPNKNSGHQSLGELQGLQYSVYCKYTDVPEGKSSRRMMCPDSKQGGHQKLHIWELPKPYSMCPFFWLVLFCILFATVKLCKFSTFLSSIAILVNYQTWGSSRNSHICSQLVRNEDDSGNPQACSWRLKWKLSCGQLCP